MRSFLVQGKLSGVILHVLNWQAALLKHGGSLLRAPVCKNQTSRGKGGKFDFSHTLMLDRLGYN